MTLQFAFGSRSRNQFDAIEGLPNSKLLANYDKTRHWQSTVNPVLGKAAHRVNVVAQHNTAALGRPFQYGWVGSTRQTNVPDGNQIYIRDSVPELSDDSGVEVLVGKELEHKEPLFLASHFNEMPLPWGRGIARGFQPRADFLHLLTQGFEIVVIP